MLAWGGILLWVSAFILMIGYIMAAFDPEKRALHDRIARLASFIRASAVRLAESTRHPRAGI
jgi:uncharacterized RDD family membrane protein YckC